MGGIKSGNGLGLMISPVFVYEWKVSSRRWQAYAQRSLFIAALLVALVVVGTGRSGGAVSPSIQGLAAIGEKFFNALVGTQLTLVLLAAPALTAGSICLDRARGTLTHLLVTDLSAAEIVLGKLAVRLIPVFSMVLCAFPVLTMLTLLGGVDTDALVGALLVTLGIAGLGSSLALAFSLWAGKTHEALLGTYAVWGLWLLGPVWIDFIGRQLGVTLWTPPRTSSPFLLAFAPYIAPGSVGLGDYVGFLVVTWTISAGLAALAVVRLRAVCSRDSVRRGASRGSKSKRHRPNRLGLGRWPSLMPGPSLDANPVLWREWHRNFSSVGSRVVVAIFMLLAVASSVLASIPGVVIHATSAVNGFQVAFGLLLLSVTASTSLAEERARGSLDVLMATPLSTQKIVLGKWLGAYRLVPLLAVLPVLVTLGASVGRFSRWPLAFLMALYVVAVGAAVTSLGVALATWCSRLGRAVGLTVTAYVLVTVGWMFLVMAMTSPHPYGMAFIAGSPFFGPIAITLQGDSSRFEWVDIFGVVVWIGIYALAAAALLSATMATFDRCLGRIQCGPESWEGRTPSLSEHVDFDLARGSEFAER